MSVTEQGNNYRILKYMPDWPLCATWDVTFISEMRQKSNPKTTFVIFLRKVGPAWAEKWPLFSGGTLCQNFASFYLSLLVMTFTTPPREESETQNLASPELGATILGYSSAFGDAAPDARWGVLSAFDDNPNTEWSSAGDGNEAWVEVELAQRARIDSVTFQTRSMSDGSAIARAFTITTDDGETFGPFKLPDANGRYDFDVTIEAKSLRFNLMDTTGGNTGAVDIAVFGEFLEN